MSKPAFSGLDRVPAAVALCRAEGDNWTLLDSSARFRALVGSGNDLFETRLRLDRPGFESAAKRAFSSGDEVWLEEVEIDSTAAAKQYRLALRADDERSLWLSLLPGQSRQITSPAHFESIVQESPDIIAMIDRGLRHRFVNKAVEVASGLATSDFEGKSHDEMGMPDELVRYFQSVYREVFATGREGRKFFDFPAPDGTLRSYESRVVPLVEPDGSVDVLLSYARDITERKASEVARLELERKMQETQRLESLGLLAGGIAHDFNNLLTSILGIASLAKAQLRRAPDPSAAVENLGQIEHACQKAADLCGQMLAYAGRGSTVKESLQVADVLRETGELLHASVQKGVVFDLELGEVSNVEVDRSQLQQVLMNLLLNAAEAMSGSGAVKVALREVAGTTVDWTVAVVAPRDTTGLLVEIEVADRGIGMDATTLSRIFDPFFTTKFAGRGLGLAATLGILRAHGAGLAVQSSPGQGTSFRLYLPPAERPEKSASEPEQEPAAMPPCRVLLVDDDEPVRAAAARMLEALGHHVTPASEGVEALARYDAAQCDFDMVLLDLTMPGMDGIATLERIRERTPTLPVVLMSGYTEEDVRGRLSDEHTTFLSKPFSFNRLEDALRVAVPAGSEASRGRTEARR